VTKVVPCFSPNAVEQCFMLRTPDLTEQLGRRCKSAKRRSRYFGSGDGSFRRGGSIRAGGRGREECGRVARLGHVRTEGTFRPRTCGGGYVAVVVGGSWATLGPPACAGGYGGWVTERVCVEDHSPVCCRSAEHALASAATRVCRRPRFDSAMSAFRSRHCARCLGPDVSPVLRLRGFPRRR